MKAILSLFPLFVKYRGRLLLGIVFVVISNFFAIIAPQLTGYIIDAAVRKNDHISIDSYNILTQAIIRYIQELDHSRLVMYAGITILFVALMKGFFMYWMRQTLVVMSRHIEYDLKNNLFHKYLELDTAFYQKQSLGDMMSRMSEDISRIRMLAGPVIMYIFNIVVILGLSLYYMVLKSPSLTIYVLLPLPILALLIYRVRRVIYQKNNIAQMALGNITGFVRNVYSGIRIVKSFNQEEALIKRFEHRSLSYQKKSISLSYSESIFTPSISAIMNIALIINVFIGGIYVINDRLSIGTLTEFVIYLNMLVFPFTAIGGVSNLVQRAVVSLNRVNEFLEIKPDIQPEGKRIVFSGRIDMRHVSFRYFDKTADSLDDVSFDIPAGSKVGIVGMIGSGKTTLFSLLMRYYDPQKGEIAIDGVPIKEMDIRSLRGQIAYVPQDPFLFSGSIIDNLKIGNPDLSEEEAKKLLEAMDLARDIETFADKEKTFIGEKGITLSGGQKQRLSIARALAIKAPILLMDDCFSAIDSETEMTILDYIDRHSLGKTMLIASHRYTIMPRLDRILVMHRGKLAEQGTHDELIAKRSLYYSLYIGADKEASTEVVP